jgi:hypothetical protein
MSPGEPAGNRRERNGGVVRARHRISCMLLPSIWGLTRIDVQMWLQERVGDDDGARE